MYLLETTPKLKDAGYFMRTSMNCIDLGTGAEVQVQCSVFCVKHFRATCMHLLTAD